MQGHKTFASASTTLTLLKERQIARGSTRHARQPRQENSGKKTAGVDGVASILPEQCIPLAESLTLAEPAQPVRRVWITKPSKTERRPLGIPTLKDRTRQTLLKMALEPEWEAQFEPNSYGFRPGRSCHDAIEAIFGAIKNKPAFVLDADISGCFDHIAHQALLDKLRTTPKIRRIIRSYLKAGVVEGNVFHETTQGTPQGGNLSPLLANIALHGLEDETKRALADALLENQKVRRGRATLSLAQKELSIIRYADDFVVLHRSQEIVLKAKSFIEQWLKRAGLELNPTKTQIVHTKEPLDNQPPGFDFLGFSIRQFPVKSNKLGYKLLIKPSPKAIKQHLNAVKQIFRNERTVPQIGLIRHLNPVVKGWSRYYVPAISGRIFGKLDNWLFWKLWQWSLRRHPNKGKGWVRRKYFRQLGQNTWRFMTHDGVYLALHTDHPIRRHGKVAGTKTPYDGNGIYWALRLNRRPGISPRVIKLLKRQQTKCHGCQRVFHDDDLMEVHHQDKNPYNNSISNLMLLHRHCHDDIHRKMKCD